MNTEAKERYYENLAGTVIRSLEKRQMAGYYVKTAAEARELALSLIPEGSSVGWGGSVTMNQIGLLDAVKAGNFRAIDRASATTPQERKAVFGQIATCDCFLMSTNAITAEGELVNVDGTANRVSFLCFGPDKVLIVAGMNKVVRDVEAGLKRARNQAAPPNCVRLERKTPCSVTGKCEDCLSPDCICCQTVITRRSSVKGRIQVILVGEELGF